MECYLVGGAVRDGLLGLPVTERDYVVVGATPAEMTAQGYKAVGRDFPVFLHPETHEEYALARTERKVAPGHQGFVCHASPEVTLEEDLRRRDLTINAMAKSADGQLIDPYGGRADLQAKRLRHVSAAFAEDPLRILRLARFKARFHHLGFAVEAGTWALICQMVADGMLAELPAERLLGEVQKAMATQSPADFFRLLLEAGAHEALWPEITSDAIDALAKRSGLASFDARLACLLQDASPPEVKGFCRRLRASRKATQLQALAAAHWQDWQRPHELSPQATLALLQAAGGFRQGSPFPSLNALCAERLDAEQAGEGRATAALWRQLHSAAASVSKADVAAASGPRLGAAIEAERLSRIARLLPK